MVQVCQDFLNLAEKNCYNLPLPKATSSLSKKVDSSAIEEANKEVTSSSLQTVTAYQFLGFVDSLA